ncbi:MAG: cytochrome c biogenesis protein CcdA [Candidatus Omnitrophota bacterium]
MNLSGSPVDYIIAFVGGILASFTPCVYPLIPVSAGFIGIKAGGSKPRGLFLSLVYVTGVAVTYSILGLLASLTGTVFGKISSHPVTHIIAGGVIILFGLSMLDLFMIPLPGVIKFSKPEKQSYFSTFILGLSSGLVVSPCLTPVLGSILFYLAAKNNLLYGAALLFSFAYGMGLVLILAGTFSAVLASLPRSGKWMLYVKRLFSFALIGMGIYFIFTGLNKL